MVFDEALDDLFVREPRYGTPLAAAFQHCLTLPDQRRERLLPACIAHPVHTALDYQEAWLLVNWRGPEHPSSGGVGVRWGRTAPAQWSWRVAGETDLRL